MSDSKSSAARWHAPPFWVYALVPSMGPFLSRWLTRHHVGFPARSWVLMLAAAAVMLALWVLTQKLGPRRPLSARRFALSLAICPVGIALADLGANYLLG
jgi:hypothetical protein